MNKKLINGDEFYEIGLKALCKVNDIPYSNNLRLKHITYNQSINDNYQYKMIRSITHDGTLSFQYNQILDMFSDLVNSKTIYKEYENVKDIKMVYYAIGDLTIENKYDVETDRMYPMMTQIFTLPIVCRCE